MAKLGYYEFFAGGGMARAGLGEQWQCLFANDFDPKKAESYKANWGGAEFRLGDIHALKPKDLPGQAHLAWASFPCQDLSLAGHGAGLAGERSGAFWGFWGLIQALPKNRRPKLLVIENVVGALTSNNSEDFVELCCALVALDYDIGALVIDAVHFLPQSRPRLFIVCAQKTLPSLALFSDEQPSLPWHTSALQRAAGKLPRHVFKAWRWWRVPHPLAHNLSLASFIEDEPVDVTWHSKAETAYLIAMMSDANKAKVAQAKLAGKKKVGTIYRRTRVDSNGEKIQCAEVRFDGVAGCLRTPGGGSSRQSIIVVEGKKIRTRLLSGREAARLMGLSDHYVLPERYNDAYHLLGDGLAVPAVRHLADNLLSFMCQYPLSTEIAAAE